MKLPFAKQIATPLAFRMGNDVLLKFILFFFVCLNLSANEKTPDNDALDNIYKILISPPNNLTKSEKYFHPDIIRDGGNNVLLQIDKESFLKTIELMASMTDSNKIKLVNKAFIVRRIINGNMANDVGYFYSKMTNKDDFDLTEDLFKFSMVFIKKDNIWQMVTDFSASKAPLEVLKDTAFARIIE